MGRKGKHTNDRMTYVHPIDCECALMKEEQASKVELDFLVRDRRNFLPQHFKRG
jgi:hypothetical protein